MAIKSVIWGFLIALFVLIGYEFNQLVAEKSYSYKELIHMKSTLKSGEYNKYYEHFLSYRAAFSYNGIRKKIKKEHPNIPREREYEIAGLLYQEIKEIDVDKGADNFRVKLKEAKTSALDSADDWVITQYGKTIAKSAVIGAVSGALIGSESGFSVGALAGGGVASALTAPTGGAIGATVGASVGAVISTIGGVMTRSAIIAALKVKGKDIVNFAGIMSATFANEVCENYAPCIDVMNKTEDQLGVKKFQKFEAELGKVIGLTNLLESERILRFQKLAEKYHIPIDYLAYLPQAKFLRGFGKHRSKKRANKKDKKTNPMSLNEAVKISNLGKKITLNISGMIIFDANNHSSVKTVDVRIMPSRICAANSVSNVGRMSTGTYPISDEKLYVRAIKKAYRKNMIDKSTRDKYLSPMVRLDAGKKCELHHLNQIDVLTGKGIYALMPMALHRGAGIMKHVHSDGLSGSGNGISQTERDSHQYPSNQSKIYKAFAEYYKAHNPKLGLM